MECSNFIEEDEYLSISGIQHFEFCKRQWALIHIEKLWKENYLTIDGELMHKNAHNEKFIEFREGVLTTRSMRVVSKELGVVGQCDVVEFQQDEINGIELFNHNGKFIPIPVEYKRGRPKKGLEE